MCNAWFLSSTQKHLKSDHRMAACHCGDRVPAQNYHLHIPYSLGHRTRYFLRLARCPCVGTVQSLEEPEQLVGGKSHVY